MDRLTDRKSSTGYTYTSISRFPVSRTQCSPLLYNCTGFTCFKGNTHPRVDIHSHKHMYTHLYIQTCTCLHKHTHTYKHVYIYTYIHTLVGTVLHSGLSFSLWSTPPLTIHPILQICNLSLVTPREDLSNDISKYNSSDVRLTWITSLEQMMVNHLNSSNE